MGRCPVLVGIEGASPAKGCGRGRGLGWPIVARTTADPALPPLATASIVMGQNGNVATNAPPAAG